MAKIIIEIEDKADGDGAIVRVNHTTEELLKIKTAASGYAMAALHAMLKVADEHGGIKQVAVN